MNTKRFFLLACLVLTSSSAVADFRIVPWMDGLSRPVKMVPILGQKNGFYVLEQAGLIRVIQNGKLLEKHALDVRDRVTPLSGGADERGLLGMALHPGYTSNGRVFLNYTTHGALRSHVSEFRRKSPNEIDPQSERVLMEVEQPYSNHNGGELVFGKDGYLYIGFGDGGSGGDPKGNGQKLDKLLGKILRIDVNQGKPYGIPADNPFIKNPEAKKEIFAYGLRNPWRFSFDRKTADLWVGDVGQNEFEEIDLVKKGDNLGWNIMEASHCYSSPKCPQEGLTLPVHEYPRDQGISVTGGFVYRGKKYPAAQGSYIFGDFGSGRIWGLRSERGRAADVKLLAKTNLNISSFAEDEEGELYVLSFPGSIHRLEF